MSDHSDDSDAASSLGCLLYGGIACVAIGTGIAWGWAVGFLVLGGAMLVTMVAGAVLLALLRRQRNQT